MARTSPILALRITAPLAPRAGRHRRSRAAPSDPFYPILTWESTPPAPAWNYGGPSEALPAALLGRAFSGQL